jgi:hypothetical protein
MHKWAVATLLVASCTLACAQEGTGQKEAAPDSSGNWFTRMFSSKSKPDPDKAAAADKTKKEPAPVVESAADKRKREVDALNRRNAVCLKLREIAMRTHDDALLDMVENLEQRAEDVYLQRTGGLPGGGSTLDEQILEKNLHSGAARPASGPIHDVSNSSGSAGGNQR